MPNSQERGERAPGQAPTPFGAESNDKMQAGLIIGPMLVGPSPLGNVGPEPVSGPTEGKRTKDPLNYKNTR